MCMRPWRHRQLKIGNVIIGFPPERRGAKTAGWENAETSPGGGGTLQTGCDEVSAKILYFYQCMYSLYSGTWHERYRDALWYVYGNRIKVGMCWPMYCTTRHTNKMITPYGIHTGNIYVYYVSHMLYVI